MRFAWLEINGWGKVAADVDATTVVVASGQATITLSSAAGFSDWVGATVYLTDCDPLPNGHYTLLSVSAPDIVVACAGQPDGSDTPAGKCRPEAFYRLCTQRPDIATSTEALATWLPVVPVESITPTFGQSVDLRGGVATADGFGLAAVYDLDGYPVLAALLRYVFSTLNSADTPVQLAAEVTQATASWTVTASAGTQNTAVYVLDGEAVSPSGVSGATWTVPTRRRGLLGTQAAPHTSTSLIFEGLPTPQGARCRLYVADLDSTDLQTTVHSVSFGVLTDVNVTEGTTLIELKAQGETIAPRVQSVGDRITATAVWASIQDSDDASAQVVITQATAADRWQWVKAGPLALQLIDSVGVPATVVGNDAVTGLPQVRYGVDAYLRPQTPACVEFVDDGTEWLNLHGHQTYRDAGGVGAPIDQPYWTDEPGADRMRLLCGPYDSQPTFSTRYPDLEPCHVFVPAGVALATEYVARRNDGAIRINPVEVVLQVLASTGTGANDYGFTAFGMASNYDVAPGQVGMGVPASQVDLVSFAAVWSALDGLSVTNCYVTASDTDNLAGWLDSHILRPYSLALVQTMRGQWRIVDMAAVDGRYDGLFVLDRNYVYTDPGARPRIEWAQNTAQSIQAIRCRWQVPNRFGFAAVRDVDIFVNGTRSDRFGSAKLYGLVTPETLLIDCPVSLGDDSESAAVLVDRYRALVGAMYRPMPVVRWRGNRTAATPDIGDLVSVEIENVPAPLGTRSAGGATTTLARVTDAKWDHLTDTVDYTAVIISTDATGIIPRAWAPAANVTAVASDTALTLSTGAYVVNPRPGDVMTNDLSPLNSGDQLLLMTRNLTLRSTDGPATIATLNTTTGALTIASAWQAGAVDITPAVDDIVIPCDWTTAPLANDIFAYQDGGAASRSWWQ